MALRAAGKIDVHDYIVLTTLIAAEAGLLTYKLYLKGALESEKRRLVSLSNAPNSALEKP